MASQVSQPDTFKRGEALVTVSNARDLDLASLRVAIGQAQTGRFLQGRIDEPWTTTKTWFGARRAELKDDVLSFVLEPAQTWNLKVGVTYQLHLQDASSSGPRTERLPWRRIRLDVTPPVDGDKAPRPVQQPTAESPEQSKKPEQEQNPNAGASSGSGSAVRGPDAGEREATSTERKTDRSSRKWTLLAALVFVLFVIAGFAYWKFVPTPTPVATQQQAAPPAVATIDSARTYVQGQHTADEALKEARRYMKAGSSEAIQGACLVFDDAWKLGSGPAATAMGRMYDPSTFKPSASCMPAADPEKALLWYQRAADKNDPEGLYRLGMLLLSGRIDEPGLGPEQGVRDLQRAASLDNTDAKAQLAKLNAAK